MNTLRTTDNRHQLEATMTEIVRQIRRLPTHWADDRTRLHGMLDALLTDWQRTDG